MSRALLIVPHFWDPICVPLGISSLRAHAARFGHEVVLFDFNTVPEVFDAQREYFSEGKRQFPEWRDWSIERNGTETLSLHQLSYLYGRKRPSYRGLVAEILNLSQQPLGAFADRLDTAPFDAIFAGLYARVAAILEELLRRVQPDIVGCTLLNSTWPATLFILGQVKALLPGARTVVGGPGPLMGIAADPRGVRSFFEAHDCIDYFVIGEGEERFLEILDNPGLAPGILDRAARAVRLDETPAPDYGTLETDRYLHLSIASSRGCPFNCSFCAETVFWNGFRSARATALLEHMDALAARHRRRSFHLCDSLSNTIIGPLTHELAAGGRGYAVDCYLRPDRGCADAARVREWRAGGLFRARLGMESASQRILDDMVKKTRVDDMQQALVNLAGAGVTTSTLWIIGYPGETEADFAATLAFIRENRELIYQADAWLFQYHQAGLPGSTTLQAAFGARHRFSPEIDELLAVPPQGLADGLAPAERFDRLTRFVRAMRELAIPNPYHLYEWVAAESRWRALGHNPGWTISQGMMALNN